MKPGKTSCQVSPGLRTDHVKSKNALIQSQESYLMPIKLRCQCGKTLNAPDSAAGKAVKCPGCAKALRVPAAGSAGPAAKSAAAKPSAAKPQVPRSTLRPTPSGADDIGSLFDEEGFSAKVESVCPSCRAEMALNAVLCTKCGYHKETGMQFERHKTAGVCWPSPPRTTTQNAVVVILFISHSQLIR